MTAAQMDPTLPYKEAAGPSSRKKPGHICEVLQQASQRCSFKPPTQPFMIYTQVSRKDKGRLACRAPVRVWHTLHSIQESCAHCQELPLVLMVQGLSGPGARRFASSRGFCSIRHFLSCSLVHLEPWCTSTPTLQGRVSGGQGTPRLWKAPQG